MSFILSLLIPIGVVVITHSCTYDVICSAKRENWDDIFSSELADGLTRCWTDMVGRREEGERRRERMG